MLKVKRLKNIYTIQTVNIEKLINPIWLLNKVQFKALPEIEKWAFYKIKVALNKEDSKPAWKCTSYSVKTMREKLADPKGDTEQSKITVGHNNTHSVVTNKMTWNH